MMLMLMFLQFVCVQLRPKARGWIYRMASSPEDLMLQFFSMQRPRRRTSPESDGENSAAGRELLELILTINTNTDGSSDDDGGDNTSNADDLFD